MRRWFRTSLLGGTDASPRCPVQRNPWRTGLVLCLLTLVEVTAAGLGLTLAGHAWAAEPALADDVLVDIDEDGRSVVITVAGEDEPAQIVDVIALCGPPAVGEPVVRAVEVRADGAVSVVYGKHAFAAIDPGSGEVTCEGAD